MNNIATKPLSGKQLKRVLNKTQFLTVSLSFNTDLVVSKEPTLKPGSRRSATIGDCKTKDVIEFM